MCKYDSTNAPDRQVSAAVKKLQRKLTIKKYHNAAMIGILQRVTGPWQERALRIAGKLDACGTFLALDVREDKPQDVRITRANFCRERLCMICAWRRQAKFVATTYPALDLLQETHRMIFITLTIQNCAPERLKIAVSQLLDGFSRLMKYKALRPVEGYIRSLEVTYEPTSKTYHPHIHCLALVPPDYFTGSGYLKQADLIQLWRKACDLSYDPNVDIRVVKTRAERDPCIEVLKYAFKPQKDLGPSNVMDYYAAFSGRRIVTFGGIVARLRRLDLDDLTDPEIDRHDSISVLHSYVLQFNVTGGLYEITEHYAKKE